MPKGKLGASSKCPRGSGSPWHLGVAQPSLVCSTHRHAHRFIHTDGAKTQTLNTHTETYSHRYTLQTHFHSQMHANGHTFTLQDTQTQTHCAGVTRSLVRPGDAVGKCRDPGGWPPNPKKFPESFPPPFTKSWSLDGLSLVKASPGLGTTWFRPLLPRPMRHPWQDSTAELLLRPWGSPLHHGPDPTPQFLGPAHRTEQLWLQEQEEQEQEWDGEWE